MKITTLDATGVALSTLCLVHCVVLPVVAIGFPVLGVLAENESLHRALALMAMVAAVLAFGSPRLPRPRSTVRLLASAGVTLLLAGAFMERLHDFETVLTIAGALLLAFAHIQRTRTLHRGEDARGHEL